MIVHKKLAKVNTLEFKKDLPSRKKRLKAWKNLVIKAFFLVGIGVILFVPYPYHTVGQVNLLTPKLQQIQTQVAGKIVQVISKAESGQLLKAGTVVAILEAPDMENFVLTTQEQVKQKQAEVKQKQAEVKQKQAEVKQKQAEVEKLLAIPKKEEVDVAKEQVEVAIKEVKVSQSQLALAITKADFSSREAKRFYELYQEGVYGAQLYENAEKQAEADKATIETVREDIAAKKEVLHRTEANLKLVLSGPYPQEIQAARDEVEVVRKELESSLNGLEASRSDLSRLQQQLKYYQAQVKRTQLVMPFDGNLASSSELLTQKIGTYLYIGDTFTIAEDDRNILAQAQIPEFEVDQLFAKSQANVKLFAYPKMSFVGKVVSIEPNTTGDQISGQTSILQQSGKIVQAVPNTSEQVVTVMISIPNPNKILKPGMTGYAKIDGSTLPVIVVFSRAIYRWIFVELWSWFP